MIVSSVNTPNIACAFAIVRRMIHVLDHRASVTTLQCVQYIYEQMRPLLLREFTRLGRSIACNILPTTPGVTLAVGQLGIQRGLERRTYCNSTAPQYAVDCVVVGAGTLCHPPQAVLSTDHRVRLAHLPGTA